MESKVLIHDDECEKTVLGTLIHDDNAYAEHSELLNEDCFYSSTNKRIWKAIKKINDRGDVCDIVFLMREFTGTSITADIIVGIAEYNDCYNITPHVLRLRKLSRQRRIWTASKKLEAAGYVDMDEDELDKIIHDCSDDIVSEDVDIEKSFINLADASEKLYKRIADNSNPSMSTSTKTGFAELDKKGGLQPNNLVIIAAESSVGKTSFANAIALNSIQYGSRVAYYSLEMRAEELAARFLSMKSGISSSALLTQPVSDEEFAKVVGAEDKINCENLLIDDRSTSSIDSILSSIRRMKAKHNIDGAIIDYLQILNVNTKSENKEQAMADAARRLKNIAKELNIWVVALSQLNRDKANPIPNLNRLRDSGQIAEAADIVLLLFRPEARIGDTTLRFPYPFEDKSTENMAMVDVAKGRNIGLSRFLVRFEPSLTLFTDISLTQIPNFTGPALTAEESEYNF